jgi:hypothetical protein
VNVENNDTNLNPETGYYWEKALIDGSRLGKPLIVGNQYLLGGAYWTYIGDFNDTKEIPNYNCCYTIGNHLYTRTMKRVYRRNTMPIKQKRERVEDTTLVNAEIADQDNSLMTMIKTSFQKKHVTKGDFKSAYDNDSDMNNCLRCIENGGNLSWNRATDVADRLNIGIKVSMYNVDNPNEVYCELDTGEPPEPVKKSSSKKK